MTPATPDRPDAARRARIRAAMIFAGVADLGFAAFFLVLGSSMFGLEERLARLLAAALAVFGVATIVAAMVVSGRRGRAARDDEPVIRR